MNKLIFFLMLAIGIAAYAFSTSNADYPHVSSAYQSVAVQTQALTHTTTTQVSDSLIWAIYSYLGHDELEDVRSALIPAGNTTALPKSEQEYRSLRQSSL